MIRLVSEVEFNRICPICEVDSVIQYKQKPFWLKGARHVIGFTNCANCSCTIFIVKDKILKKELNSA